MTLEIVAILLGLLLRIGIPVSITALLAWFLQRLDTRWRAESLAEHLAEHPPTASILEKMVPCYIMNNCPHERRATCKAYQQPDVPCWEVFRVNGRLQDKCVDCRVLRQALMPLSA